MKRRHIIIVDRDKNNQQVLSNHFMEFNFSVDLAVSNIEAQKLVKTRPYDAMITELSSPGIDGYDLLEMIKKTDLNASAPVLFLTTKNDVWNRVKSLQSGAKDYIIKPVHIKELVARVNMLLNRIERKSEEEQIYKKKFSGKLEDISVFDLIKVFGLEKKTGILNLFKENGHTGQIFFEKGNIINAGTLLLNAELAVYKMMTWRKGFFSMHFCDIDILNNINISNLAILLQGAMRMEYAEDLSKNLPPLTAVLVTTSNFKKITAKQELKSELQQFLELFDGQRTLEEIIDDSKSDEIETLKRVQKLFDMGFLNIMDQDQMVDAIPKESEKTDQNALIDDLLGKPESETTVTQDIHEYDLTSLVQDSQPKQTFTRQTVKPELPQPVSETAVQEQYTPETRLENKLENQTASQFEQYFVKAKGSVLIIGKDMEQGKKMVDNLSSVPPVMKNAQMNSISDIYVGTAAFKKDMYLNLTSISTEKEFDPLLEYFSPKTLGYILLVDTQRANWNYYFYLLNVLRRRLRVPSVIVISHKGTGEHSITIDEIRTRLNLKEHEKITFCSEFNETNSKKIIFSLFKNYYKKA